MAKPDVQPGAPDVAGPDVQPDVDAPDVDAALARMDAALARHAADWRAAHDASCTCGAWRAPSDAPDGEPAPLEAGGAQPW